MNSAAYVRYLDAMGIALLREQKQTSSKESRSQWVIKLSGVFGWTCDFKSLAEIDAWLRRWTRSQIGVRHALEHFRSACLEADEGTLKSIEDWALRGRYCSYTRALKNEMEAIEYSQVMLPRKWRPIATELLAPLVGRPAKITSMYLPDVYMSAKLQRCGLPSMPAVQGAELGPMWT